MLKYITSSILRAVVLILSLGVVISSYAQVASDQDSLSKESFAWSQEQIDTYFLNYDVGRKSRDVPAGGPVKELPLGSPIEAFSKGGEKADELDEFISKQWVAGLLILQDGKIRLERFEHGHSEASKWVSASVAKSFTSTLVGVAIKEGYIQSVDDYVADYIPDLKGSAYENVTVHQLLTMTSGVRWNENYTDPNSDLVKFFEAPIEPGMDQTVSYMRQLPAQAEPGKVWKYSTGETHLLGQLVSSATGRTLSDYLSSKVWIPYGMEDTATWILNQTNSELAGCCLQMRLRDFGRYGQFVLDEGRINGTSIVPEGWFQTATRTQRPVWGNLGYGYQWWTYADGTFQALGIHGQVVHIDPSRQLVIVINSAWPEPENAMRRGVVNDFIKSISREIDKERSESPNP